MKDGDVIKVVCIKDYSVHKSVNAYRKFAIKGNHYIIFVAERWLWQARRQEREDEREDGDNFYYELCDLDENILVSIYSSAILKEHFISIGDFREQRINEILN